MAEKNPGGPSPADEGSGIEDRSEYTPSVTSNVNPTGKSFQASPTGLGATDEPATSEDGTVGRFSEAQSDETSRAAWTPGAEETADRTRPAAGPRGTGIVLIVLLVALVLLALFVLI